MQVTTTSTHVGARSGRSRLNARPVIVLARFRRLLHRRERAPTAHGGSGEVGAEAVGASTGELQILSNRR